MTTPREYFKLVSADWSSWYEVSEMYSLHYVLGEETKPRVGGILVFSTLQQLKGFYFKGFCSTDRTEGANRGVVLAGVGEQMELPSCSGFFSEDYPVVWDLSPNGLAQLAKLDVMIHPRLGIWPAGTVAVQSFTPQRVVPKEGLGVLNEG